MLPRAPRIRHAVPLLAAGALALGLTTATAFATPAAQAGRPAASSPQPSAGPTSTPAWGLNSHVASAVYAQVDGAPSAWRSGIDGRGVGVAVVDTGIDDSGDLAGKVIDGFDFSGEGDYTKDSYGHGTFVAGTIAGSGAASGGAITGVAPGANLISLKVAGANGKTDVVRVMFAIEWAIAHAKADNIRVLSLSLGTEALQSWDVDPLNRAIEDAWRAGLVVTIAAGNTGPDGISKPADDPFVVTVGASDDATTLSRADDTVAPFSATGPTTHGIAKPDLVAPGSHVVSTRSPGSTVDLDHPESRVLDAYFRGSGTSFAAPQVAGAAALLLQQRPQLSNDHVKAMLMRTAVPIAGAPAGAQGAGALDIPALLAANPGKPANTGVKVSSSTGTVNLNPGLLQNLAKRTVSWDTVSWDTVSWDSAPWHGKPWDTVSWDTVSWDTVSWDTVSWDVSSWN